MVFGFSFLLLLRREKTMMCFPLIKASNVVEVIEMLHAMLTKNIHVIKQEMMWLALAWYAEADNIISLCIGTRTSLRGGQQMRFLHTDGPVVVLPAWLENVSGV
jgi:hypothetical protein